MSLHFKLGYFCWWSTDKRIAAPLILRKHLHRDSVGLFKRHERPLFTFKAHNIQKFMLRSLVEVHNICPWSIYFRYLCQQSQLPREAIEKICLLTQHSRSNSSKSGQNFMQQNTLFPLMVFILLRMIRSTTEHRHPRSQHRPSWKSIVVSAPTGNLTIPPLQFLPFGSLFVCAFPGTPRLFI